MADDETTQEFDSSSSGSYVMLDEMSESMFDILSSQVLHDVKSAKYFVFQRNTVHSHLLDALLQKVKCLDLERRRMSQ